MKWICVNAFFESDNVDLAEELVSHIFFSQGLKGVVCQIPLPEPVDEFANDAVPLPEANAIVGYLPDTISSEKKLETLIKKMTSLIETGIHVTIRTEIIDQEDWAESWKEFFYVSRITDTIVIKPEWRDYTAQPNDVIIEIDPGMAFGTGTHPTTAMCIGMIEKHLVPGSSFLDIGTGSGILMIAAAKLGAAHLTGIDNDEVAVHVANENLSKNSIASEKYHISHSTLDCYDNGPDETFDLIAANIIAEVIIEIMPQIKKRLGLSGTIILSGIIDGKKDDVIAALTMNGLSIIEIQSRKEWTTFAVNHNL